MTTRAYLVASGLIFGGVAVLHLLRVANGWGFEIGPLSLPMSVSWIGTAVTAFLCVWALRAAARGR